MAILEIVSALLPALVPQDPTPTGAPDTAGVSSPTASSQVLRHADLLPDDTLMSLVVHPTTSYQDHWTGDPLADLVLDSGLGTLLGTAARSYLGEWARDVELEDADLRRVLHGGFGFSWHGNSAAGPMWTAVFQLGESTDRFKMALDRLYETHGDAVARESFKQVEIATFGSVSLTINGSRLLVGNDVPTVTAALERMSRSATHPCLADTTEYRAFVADARDAAPVVTLWCQGARMLRRLAHQLPEEHGANALALFERLELHQLDTCGIQVAAENGQVVEHARIGFTEVPSGILGALLRGSKTGFGDLAGDVPENAAAFTAFTLPWASVADGATELLRSVAKDLAKDLSAFETESARQTGVHLRRDLIATISATNLAFAIPPAKPGDVAGLVLSARLVDGWAFTQAFEKFAPVLPIDITEVTDEGGRTWRLHLRGLPDTFTPTLTVAHNRLILASTTEARASALNAIQDDAEHPNARRILTQSAPGALASTWCDLGTLTGRSDGEFGTLVSSCVSEGSTVRWLQMSRTGTLGLVFASKTWSAPADTTDPATGIPSTENDIATLIRTIHGAQMEFRTAATTDRDGDSVGEFGTLSDLTHMGAVALSRQEDAWLFDGYRVAVLLPESADERETQFVVVAWPSEQATGPVYAALPTEPLLVNDVLAGVSGLTAIELRDVFLDAAMANGMTGGWRNEAGLTVTEVTPAVEPAPQDPAEAVRRLAMLEALGKEASTASISVFVGSSAPSVARRALWLLAQQNRKDGAPAVLEALQAESVEVRREAMATLLRFQLPTTLETTIVALDDTDKQVRLRAAALLGRLGDKRAVAPLIDALSRGEGEAADRTQMLLSLHDLGDAAKLMETAAAVRRATGKTEEALAWQFQQLSAKLGDGEFQLMLSVLDHDSKLVRRFAIQRLGQLGDTHAIPALEGRLAVEDKELRELAAVSLATLRGPVSASDRASETFDQVKETAQEWWADGKQRWNAMDKREQMLFLSCVAAGFSALLLLIWMRRRRRRAIAMDATLAMVAPSDDFEEEDDYEYESEEDNEETYAEVGPGAQWDKPRR